MSALTVLTEDPGGSPLARAAREGTAPAGWFEPTPVGAAGWSARAAHVASGLAGRDWVLPLAAALGTRGAAIVRAAGPNALALTTGQQPGLFGGPLYTLHKALSARAHARAIATATGRSVVPIFWAATDDSDFAEARSAFVAMRDGLVSLTATDVPPEGTSLSAAPLGSAAGLVRDVAEAGGSAADAEVIAQLRAAYAPDRTHGAAYVALLRAVLEPMGIAVLDAAHPAVRQAGNPLLRRALAGWQAVERAVAERTSSIAAAGFSPQVEPVSGMTLVFANDGGVRRRIAGAESERAANLPDDALSANVLLRPVMERAIIPTLAYIAGPGEQAYFAQSAAVAAVLETPAPLALGRWSGTIVEPRIARILERLGVSVAELAEPARVAGRLASAQVPGATHDALATLRAQIDAQLGRIGEDAVPAPVVEGARRSLFHRLERLERRLLAAAKRRADEPQRDLATVVAAIRPNGHRQERVLAWLPFLARYGPELIAALDTATQTHADARIAGGADAPPA